MDPVNPQAFLAILLGGLTLLIPVAGLTARFALKPLIEAWARARNPGLDQNYALAARVQQMEHRLLEIESHTPINGNAVLMSDRSDAS